MLGLGIDSVEIERFKNWPNYTKKQLLKIFAEQEIAYCLSNSAKSIERFASHFAAKEAFFKAVSPILKTQIPFLAVCKNIYLTKLPNGAPKLNVNWKQFKLINLHIHISITHTKNIASTIVILNKN